MEVMFGRPVQRHSPARLGKRRAKVARVMREFAEGELHSSSGQTVKSRDQAIAIAMSEAGMSRARKGKP